MKIFLLLSLMFVTGCSSFGKGIAEAFLDKSAKEDTRKCEIKGTPFEGINYYFSKGDTVKILMVHGVGTHIPGYSARLQDNLAEKLGLNAVSRRAKEISLVSPSDGKTNVGKLLVTRLYNKEGTKDLIFYELTWSEITQPEKEILSYDSSKEYTYKRAAFNNTMKKFLDDTGPDPLIYLSDKRSLILDAFKQSDCWMLGYNWDNLPQSAHKVCSISSAAQLSNLNHEKIIFITHSLGSRILIDGFEDIIKQVRSEDVQKHVEAHSILEALKTKDFTVFMLANQLPILQIGHKAPEVTNQYKSYCRPKGEHYNQRVFKRINIVAFSDPNDLLSYDIPQKFVDTYMDSRMCPVVTNVNINIAKEVSAFGVGLVNPMTAHTEYENDSRIVDIMAYGAGEKDSSKEVDKRCEFVYIK